MKLYRFLLLSLVLMTVPAVFLLILTGLKFTAESNTKNYILRSYKNTVALYENDKLIEVYSDVVLNNLPESDRYALNSGIEFGNIKDAKLAIEDYDG